MGCHVGWRGWVQNSPYKKAYELKKSKKNFHRVLVKSLIAGGHWGWGESFFSRLAFWSPIMNQRKNNGDFAWNGIVLSIEVPIESAVVSQPATKERRPSWRRLRGFGRKGRGRNGVWLCAAGNPRGIQASCGPIRGRNFNIIIWSF